MGVAVGFPVITTDLFGQVSSTNAELDAVADKSARYVAAGATKTLTLAANDEQLVKLDTAAGSVVTLPAASGSGAKFKFLVTLKATSNSHIIKVANSSDTMVGFIAVTDLDDNSTLVFWAGATGDTITLNRTTTGSASLGEYIEVEDQATNVWSVRGNASCAAGSNPATPFSATV